MNTEFDQPAALAFLGGEEALLHTVLQAFLDSAHAPLDAFLIAVADEDREGVRRYLHRLTPTLKIIATPSLNALLHNVHEHWRSDAAISVEQRQQTELLGRRVTALLAQVARYQAG